MGSGVHPAKPRRGLPEQYCLLAADQASLPYAFYLTDDSSASRGLPTLLLTSIDAARDVLFFETNSRVAARRQQTHYITAGSIQILRSVQYRVLYSSGVKAFSQLYRRRILCAHDCTSYKDATCALSRLVREPRARGGAVPCSP